MALRVRVSPVLLDEITVSSPEKLPVEVTQIIAGQVLAVLRELGGKSGERRPVKSGDKALDYRAGEKFKRTDARKDLRWNEPLRRPGLERRRRFWLDDRAGFFRSLCFVTPPHLLWFLLAD